jgi:hypothetical protein
MWETKSQFFSGRYIECGQTLQPMNVRSSKGSKMRHVTSSLQISSTYKPYTTLHHIMHFEILTFLRFYSFVYKINMKLWEELITYFPLIWFRPHRRWHIQQFFYCCMCICSWRNVFTEPLPSNDRGDTDADIQGKYANNRGTVSSVFSAVWPKSYIKRTIQDQLSNLCGGGVKYLHRDPASCRMRRIGKSQIWDSKMWSRVPRDLDPRKTALARASSIYKRQTHPLVREGTQQKQDLNCQTVIKTYWLTVSRNVTLTLTLTWSAVSWEFHDPKNRETVKYSHESRRTWNQEWLVARISSNLPDRPWLVVRVVMQRNPKVVDLIT